ncbi:MAG: hypothetical protein AAGD05_17645, partial [Bacteroidota bacterium]
MGKRISRLKYLELDANDLTILNALKTQQEMTESTAPHSSFRLESKAGSRSDLHFQFNFEDATTVVMSPDIAPTVATPGFLRKSFRQLRQSCWNFRKEIALVLLAYSFIFTVIGTLGAGLFVPSSTSATTELNSLSIAPFELLVTLYDRLEEWPAELATETASLAESTAKLEAPATKATIITEVPPTPEPAMVPALVNPDVAEPTIEEVEDQVEVEVIVQDHSTKQFAVALPVPIEKPSIAIAPEKIEVK